ncbi:hypothetical protein KVR01_002804 [Diaporthe batatas]|uniref:uncharacterized protein n=1 Tax=Diaporthe batatas TaxID=748121 RepID=UPI001D059D99|nr:uncharacterized protein KVR01_002804 [Diaporthe batatas]KAG8167115.1 hypothetical protein KVR01_002804 [Diaporthe batatas]
MGIADNLGLRALISACKFCPFQICDCADDLSKVRESVFDFLDPAHANQVDQNTFNAICHDLDKHPHSHSFPTISPDEEKQRDDGVFESSVDAAFNIFREMERDFLLKVPVGPLRHDDTTTKYWWDGAAHLRHHVEFLLVLKGVKPCVLFSKNKPEHTSVFSSVVMDILIPVMNHMQLWSYGFKISFECLEWVFYDARSPLLPQITKIFLTDHTSKKVDRTGAYPAKDSDKPYLVPHLEVAQALAYPIRSDHFDSDCYVNIQDATEMDVLECMGRPRPHCCVYGMGFGSPVGNEDDWMKILTHYHKCAETARKFGTDLRLVLKHEKMTAWLTSNPGWLVGPVPWVGRSGPKLQEISDKP